MGVLGLVTKLFLSRRAVGRGPAGEHIMARQHVVNGCLRECADPIIDHLIGQLAVANVRVKLSVGNNGFNFLWQDLAVIVWLSGFRSQKVSLVVEPAIVGAFLDVVKK